MEYLLPNTNISKLKVYKYDILKFKIKKKLNK